VAKRSTSDRPNEETSGPADRQVDEVPDSTGPVTALPVVVRYYERGDSYTNGCSHHTPKCDRQGIRPDVTDVSFDRREIAARERENVTRLARQQPERVACCAEEGALLPMALRGATHANRAPVQD
jgi:hypothetical protein